MLALQTQSRIVPKIMKMADGRLALVHFLVSFENGEFKAQVISVRFSDGDSKSVGNSSSVLVLCGACEKAGEIVSKTSRSYESVVSPYAKLAFFMSQPTRAPAFV